jgi:hypothetical protein
MAPLLLLLQLGKPSRACWSPAAAAEIRAAAILCLNSSIVSTAVLPELGGLLIPTAAICCTC